MGDGRETTPGVLYGPPRPPFPLGQPATTAELNPRSFLRFTRAGWAPGRGSAPPQDGKHESKEFPWTHSCRVGAARGPYGDTKML